jgi:hypothetical protein
MKTCFSFFLLLLSTSCYTIDRECADFKTGTFEFTYTIDGIEKTGKFIRTEMVNIDYYEGKVDSSSVRWINDCEFILKKLNPKRMAEKDAIHMKILATTNNSYTFEYKLAVDKPNKPTRTEKGVAKKIN